MRFTELQLEPALYSAIEKLGFQECTPIQDACFEIVVEGRDAAGLAQTGTGKTAAFLIPLMDRILKAQVPLDQQPEEKKELFKKRAFTEWRAQNFILILVPTRELAEQVQENIQKLNQVSGLRSVSVYGGTGYDKQKDGFKAGVEFVVATPGRLIDLYKEHFVDLKQVRCLVFDEADRMFDMGFKEDMKFILSRVPKERQILVFSATLNFDVTNTIYQFGADPVEINVSRDQTKAENVKDVIYHCGGDEKGRFLLSLLKKMNPAQSIIFCNYKHSVEKLAKFLSINGVPAMGISSLLSQSQRLRVMEQFKAVNEQNVLVATDVAARGLDIKGVDLVVNFDLPQDAESYVHRIGRTGRAGEEGRAFSLVSDRDVESLSRIESFLKHKLEVGWMDEAELLKDFKPLNFSDQSEGRKSHDGPRRDFNRKSGPRREGGRDAGGRDNRDGRGPRRDGPRSESRGPRPEGGRHEGGRNEGRGPRHDGPRPDGAAPHDASAPREGGGRPEGARHEGGRGRSHDSRRPSGDKRQANGNGHPNSGSGNGAPRGRRPEHSGPRSENGRPQHARPNGRGEGKPAHAAKGSPSSHARKPGAGPSRPPKTIKDKVSGFLKKLFT